jgi:hypothetical protein
MIKMRLSANSHPTDEAFGRFPLISLAVAGSIGLLAVAYSGARQGAPWAVALYWASIILIFALVLARLAWPAVGRTERLGLLLVLGLSQYLIKFFHSPLYFTFSDEFAHWRNVLNIDQFQRLFEYNPLIPATVYYPGLELFTHAVGSITGLPDFAAGVILQAVSRVVLMLSLFLVYERLSQSPWEASLATVLYTANPSFVYFDAQFSYESLSLPLVAWVLFVVLRVNQHRIGSRLGVAVVALLGVSAVTFTHHLSAYALVAFLVVWLMIDLGMAWFHRRQPHHDEFEPIPGPGWIAILALGINLLWFWQAGGATTDYLTPVFSNAFEEFYRMITGQAASRTLFQSGTGQVAPLLERLTGFASVGFLLLALPLGYFQVWLRRRRHSIFILFLLGILIYPMSLALRFTRAGGETAQRTSAFVFVAMAVVIASGLAAYWPKTIRWQRMWATGVTLAGTVVFLGGVIVGWARWARLPGPYAVGADTRSVETEGIAAAEWSFDHLGAENRILADRTNRFLMAAYGRQNPIGTRAGDVLFADEIGNPQCSVIRNREVVYIYSDLRLSQQLPELGIYADSKEPGAYKHTQPIRLEALTKFASLTNVDRIFDSGDIAIYDVRVYCYVP